MVQFMVERTDNYYHQTCDQTNNHYNSGSDHYCITSLWLNIHVLDVCIWRLICTCQIVVQFVFNFFLVWNFVLIIKFWFLFCIYYFWYICPPQQGGGGHRNTSVCVPLHFVDQATLQKTLNGCSWNFVGMSPYEHLYM